MVNFVTIWNNHPEFGNLYDSKNQCAVRMGTTLMKSKIDMSSFSGVKCGDQEQKSLKTTLRAQELADWMAREPNHFGNVDVITKNTTYKDFTNRKGLVFFQDGCGTTDHIDIWNGSSMKAGAKNYFAKAKEVWFWDLP